VVTALISEVRSWDGWPVTDIIPSQYLIISQHIPTLRGQFLWSGITETGINTVLLYYHNVVMMYIFFVLCIFCNLNCCCIKL